MFSAAAMPFWIVLATVSARGAASSPAMPISGGRPLAATRPTATPVQTSTDQPTLLAVSAASGRRPAKVPNPAVASSRASCNRSPSRMASHATRSSIALEPADPCNVVSALGWSLIRAAAFPFLGAGASLPKPASFLSGEACRRRRVPASIRPWTSRTRPAYWVTSPTLTMVRPGGTASRAPSTPRRVPGRSRTYFGPSSCRSELVAEIPARSKVALGTGMPPLTPTTSRLARRPSPMSSMPSRRRLAQTTTSPSSNDATSSTEPIIGKAPLHAQPVQPEQHLQDQGGHGEGHGLHGRGPQAIQVTPAQLADGEASGDRQQQDGEGSEAHGASRPLLGAARVVGQAAMLVVADTECAEGGFRGGLTSDHLPFERLKPCDQLGGSLLVRGLSPRTSVSRGSRASS